jgi:hypothetical protein
VSIKNSNDTIGNRTRDLPACSAVYASTWSFKMTNISSLFPTDGIFYKYLSFVDTCHITGAVHLYKYRPLDRFSTTVGKCKEGQRNHRCLFIYQIKTCHEYECLPHKPSRGNGMKSIKLVSSTMHNYWRTCQIHQW